MISYAQNREDILLNRAFKSTSDGFYIDVGAAHPLIDSVTRLFYDRGWRGINIEPRPSMFECLVRDRPRDLNLNIGVSNHSGVQRFFEINAPGDSNSDGGGLSTLDPATADESHREGRRVTEYLVTMKTLTEVCVEHGVVDISFLKIDAEGHERHVLEGLDCHRFRPKVLVIEATLPLTNVPCHSEWEPSLLAADYLYATFDGLNRYYIRREDEQLLKYFEVPVNVLDGYVPYETVRLRREIQELRQKLNRTLGARTKLVLGKFSSWFRSRNGARSLQRPAPLGEMGTSSKHIGRH